MRRIRRIVLLGLHVGDVVLVLVVVVVDDI